MSEAELLRMIDELRAKMELEEVIEIGNAKVQDYLWIGASSVRGVGAKPATIGLNDNGFIRAIFADGQEQQVQANIKFPIAMDYDEDFDICLGWSSPAQSLDCDWEVTYLITALGESTDQAGTLLQSYETSSATANGLTLSAFTVAAAHINTGDVCVHIVAERDGNDGSDTLGNVAELTGMALRFISS